MGYGGGRLGAAEMSSGDRGASDWGAVPDSLRRWRVVVGSRLCAVASLACRPPCLLPPQAGTVSRLAASSATGLRSPEWQLPAGQRVDGNRGLQVNGPELGLWLVVRVLRRIRVLVGCV